MKTLATLLTALVATACAVDAPDDDLAAGDGKADGASATKLAGEYTKLYFEGGTVNESGMLRLPPLDNGKVRMQLSSRSAAGEGQVVDENFVLEDRFAERSFGPDCTLYISYLDGEFDLHQTGTCAAHLPAGLQFGGRYKRAYATGKVLSYVGDDDPANAMTMIWMGARIEFHLGSGEAMAAGFVINASTTRPVVYMRDNCTLTFTFTGEPVATDAIDVTQVGECGIGGGDYTMHWTLSE